LGGSELTSISATCITRSARAAHTEEALDGRKEGGVKDINKNDGGSKKQRASNGAGSIGIIAMLQDCPPAPLAHTIYMVEKDL
jgi:hypothetical protein